MNIFDLLGNEYISAHMIFGDGTIVENDDTFVLESIDEDGMTIIILSKCWPNQKRLYVKYEDIAGSRSTGRVWIPETDELVVKPILVSSLPEY